MRFHSNIYLGVNMKMKKSPYSPFVVNIFGVGGFFFFLLLFILLHPLFYIFNYSLFSIFENKNDKIKENEEKKFVILQESRIKEKLLQINSLEFLEAADWSDFKKDNSFSFKIEKSPLFMSLISTEDIFFSKLVDTVQYAEIYYKSYTIFLDKRDNSLHLKDNFFLVYDYQNKLFDDNYIDSIKMKMDKINYDFQLELERWKGRFAQKNRKVIAEIIHFVNNSNLPATLKKDVTLMFDNNLVLWDFEVYLEEFISLLNNMQVKSNDMKYQDVLDFLQKKYAQLYKIKLKDGIGDDKSSVYDFFKSDNLFISDNLKAVLKKEILIKKDYSGKLDLNQMKIKRLGKNILIDDGNWKLKLLNEKGEILKEERRVLDSFLFLLIFLILIFFMKFLEKNIFFFIAALILMFIIFFLRCFFIESLLMFLYVGIVRRCKLK